MSMMAVDNMDDVSDAGCQSETNQVIIVSYPQYCRYRAMMKRLDLPNGGMESHAHLELAVVRAVGGLSSSLAVVDCGRRFHVMFCRSAVSHPEVETHEFRRDYLGM
jgi:hypothetical protein